MINPMSLERKNIIITGAASGIGKETAIVLSELGASLLLLDVDKEGLARTKNLLKGPAETKVCDLTEFHFLKELIVPTKNRRGKYTGLVHCAGIPAVVPLRVLSDEIYERVQKINVQAGLNLAKIFSGRGVYDSGCVCSIVYISSVYGIVGSAANVAYAVSKAAIVGMTKSLAIELAPKKIRVNCVAPGFVKTSMADGVNTMFDEKYTNYIETMHPLGWGEAADIANGIAFLLSDASKWTTGAVLNIDGGFTAQ